MKARTLLILVITMLVAACNKKVATVVTLTDSTSIATNNITIDKEVQLAPDSALVAALLRCDSLGNVYLAEINTLNGERVKQQLTLKDNNLTVTATDAAKERIIYLRYDSIVYQRKEVPVPYPVVEYTNELTQWQIFQIWLGRILLAAVLFYAIKIKFKGSLNSVINLIKKV